MTSVRPTTSPGFRSRRAKTCATPSDLVARGFDKARLKHSLTSGSTGRRTTSYFDADAWMMGKHLLKLRARLACGVRPWDRVAILHETAVRRRHRRSCRAARVRSRSTVRSMRCCRSSALSRLRCSSGYPGYLLHLGRRAAGSLRPRLVFTSGEMLDELTRSGIEEAFRARVLDVYGCTEVKEIAWECPRREGYHVNADWLLLEVQPTGPGDGRQAGNAAGHVPLQPSHAARAL